ncbi:diguanylate cyclase (GGDEF)-like protein [Hoeflea marina]|uniref:diguanylate cyclase n=2 Tax=Hoeflea marina TaxID=274592 RepID=A0A317PGH4_9HYPH|nr:diguanylate cyclase (GGDEF)-like protein [Hoeflea marina]
MRKKGFHKAEIFLFFLMLLIGLAGASSWAAWSMAIGGGDVTGGAHTVGQFTFLAMVLSGLAFTCSLLLILPTLSRGLREQGKLQRMTETLSMRSQTLEHAAVTDAMTGMYNRRYFDEALVEYLAAFKRIRKPIGMAVFDLDHFKSVNDTYGHDVGDEVLRRVAGCFQDFTRYHDVVARLGGEEFAILSPNINERQLFDLSDRVRQAVSQLNLEAGNVTLRVTISVGLAIWDGSESGEDLYRRADKQLYEAKRKGRNRVCAA